MHFSVYSYQHCKVYMVGTLEQCNSQAAWFKYMIENEKKISSKKMHTQYRPVESQPDNNKLPKKCNGNA